MVIPAPLPAECALIRRKREEMLPPVSMREAARRARAFGAQISATYWRRCESGQYLPRVPAGALAYMAMVTETLPGELERSGRPDAAAALRAEARRQASRVTELPAAAPAAPGGLDRLLAEIVSGLGDIDASRKLTKTQKAELKEELIAGIMRDAAERQKNLRAVLRIADRRDVS
jgi:hypothetical protein